MLPADWTGNEGPEFLKLSGDLNVLFQRYMVDLDGGQVFEQMLRQAVAAGADSVMVERDYIDSDYRDEFAHFYAQTFRPLPDRCQRLHFLNEAEQAYVGFSVLRPVTGRPISRTVLAPKAALEQAVSCTATSKTAPYGYRFSVSGFPFISQDYQYGVCAHAAIWMIAHYFHLRFKRSRFYISDIVESAGIVPSSQRQTPSSGLTHPQITAALETMKMPAIAYRLDGLPNDETAETVACRYLNSAIPVIVLGSRHARVLVGYGPDEEADGGIFFVCHDDQRGPYRGIAEVQAGYAQDTDLLSWEHLLAPMPGRIYLAGEAAEREGKVALRAEMQAAANLTEHLARLDANESRLRSYVIESSEYKRQLRRRGLPADVVAFHGRASLSHWVWIVELQDRKAANRGRDCVIGEIVIDATSDDLHPNFLIANLPGRLMRWMSLGAPTQSTTSNQSKLYTTGSAIHL